MVERVKWEVVERVKWEVVERVKWEVVERVKWEVVGNDGAVGRGLIHALKSNEFVATIYLPSNVLPIGLSFPSSALFSKVRKLT